MFTKLFTQKVLNWFNQVNACQISPTTEEILFGTHDTAIIRKFSYAASFMFCRKKLCKISETVSTSKITKYFTLNSLLWSSDNTQVKHCGVLISVIHICLHNLCCMLLLPGGERPMICNVLSNYSIRYQFTRGSPLLIGLTIKLSEAPFLGHINLEKKQVLPT